MSYFVSDALLLTCLTLPVTCITGGGLFHLGQNLYITRNCLTWNISETLKYMTLELCSIVIGTIEKSNLVCSNTLHFCFWRLYCS